MRLSKEEANLVLQGFAGALGLGLGELSFGPENSAVVGFGEDQALIFEYSEAEGCIVLWTPLLSLALAETPAAETALLKFLLGLNLQSPQVDGGFVALD